MLAVAADGAGKNGVDRLGEIVAVNSVCVMLS